MPGTFFKSLAIATGTGLAIGLGSTFRLRWSKAPSKREDILRLEPLLDRLERLEARVGHGPEELQTQLRRHTDDLSVLRVRIDEAEERAGEATCLIEAQFTQVRAEVPRLVDAGIADRMNDLRARLQRDLEENQKRTFERFELALEEKIASRISGIEAKLTQQSAVLETMTARSVETDQNLRRLIGAVQKLVDQTIVNGVPDDSASVKAQFEEDAANHPRASDPGLTDLPFQAHLEQAIVNGHEANAVRQEPAKKRMPLAPLMMITFMIGSRLFR